MPSDHAYGTSMHNDSESRSVVSDSLRPHGLYSSWNSLGQNTGVGSHSLLQGILPIQGGFFTSWVTRKPKNTGVGSLFLLQQILLTQELNQGLLIANRFFTSWAIREALKYELKHAARHQKNKTKHWVSSQSWDRFQGKKFVGFCGFQEKFSSNFRASASLVAQC